MDRASDPRPASDQLQLFGPSGGKSDETHHGHQRRRGGQACECGSPLRWETRQRLAGVHRIALCHNPACGIVTPSKDNGEFDDPLRRYLIGDGPARRYLPPWLRFLHQAMAGGFKCRVSDRDCPEADCGSQATMAVDLPPTIPRFGDGVRARVCLTCGGVLIEYWHMGERCEIGSDGGDWVRLDGPVVGLKSALEERLEARRCDGPDGN